MPITRYALEQSVGNLTLNFIFFKLLSTTYSGIFAVTSPAQITDETLYGKNAEKDLNYFISTAASVFSLSSMINSNAIKFIKNDIPWTFFWLFVLSQAVMIITAFVLFPKQNNFLIVTPVFWFTRTIAFMLLLLYFNDIATWTITIFNFVANSVMKSSDQSAWMAAITGWTMASVTGDGNTFPTMIGYSMRWLAFASVKILLMARDLALAISIIFGPLAIVVGYWKNWHGEEFGTSLLGGWVRQFFSLLIQGPIIALCLMALAVLSTISMPGFYSTMAVSAYGLAALWIARSIPRLSDSLGGASAEGMMQGVAGLTNKAFSGMMYTTPFGVTSGMPGLTNGIRGAFGLSPAYSGGEGFLQSNASLATTGISSTTSTFNEVPQPHLLASAGFSGLSKSDFPEGVSPAHLDEGSLFSFTKTNANPANSESTMFPDLLRTPSDYSFNHLSEVALGQGVSLSPQGVGTASLDPHSLATLEKARMLSGLSRGVPLSGMMELGPGGYSQLQYSGTPHSPTDGTIDENTYTPGNSGLGSFTPASTSEAPFFATGSDFSNGLGGESHAQDISGVPLLEMPSYEDASFDKVDENGSGQSSSYGGFSGSYASGYEDARENSEGQAPATSVSADGYGEASHEDEGRESEIRSEEKHSASALERSEPEKSTRRERSMGEESLGASPNGYSGTGSGSSKNGRAKQLGRSA